MEPPNNEWPDDLKLIAQRQAAFAKRWQPFGRYEREEFHRELLELIHLIYREAQYPMVKQIEDMINRMPISWAPGSVTTASGIK